MSIVKVSQLGNTPKIQYAHTGDSGVDLYPSVDVTIPAKAIGYTIPLGVRFVLPEKYELQIRPKSGNSIKTPIRVILGTIDNGYRGEVSAIVDNLSDEPYEWNMNKAIAQGVFQLVERITMEYVSDNDVCMDTSRGTGGFGSTGRGF